MLLSGLVILGGAAAFGFNAWTEKQAPSFGHQTEAWELLGRIDVEDVSDDILPKLIKTFPEDIRSATEGFQIEGYLVRFVAEPYLQEFLIVPDPPSCLFCGGAGYGSYLEVQMRAPLDDLPDFTKLSLRGELVLVEDPTVYDTAKLVDAVLLSDPSQ